MGTDKRDTGAGVAERGMMREGGGVILLGQCCYRCFLLHATQWGRQRWDQPAKQRQGGGLVTTS